MCVLRISFGADSVVERGQRPSLFRLLGPWFVEREKTLVRLEVSDWYTAHEVARTFEQLAARLTLDAIVVNDGRTEGIDTFARECGLTNVEEIDAVSRQSGDDPRGLLALPSFVEHSGRVTAEGDVYDGSFPWPGMELTPEHLPRISTLETSQELRARIATRRSLPLGSPLRISWPSSIPSAVATPERHGWR